MALNQFWLLSIWPPEHWHFLEIPVEINSKKSIWIFFCKMSAIVFRDQWVKLLHPISNYLWVWISHGTGSTILRLNHAVTFIEKYPSYTKHMTWQIQRNCDKAAHYACSGVPPRGGTPYVMGDTYVPRFWPPFFTLAGSSTIFLGYFSHPPTAKLSFGVQKLPIFTKIDLFGPKFNFFLDLFGSNFQRPAAHPHQFSGRVPPPGVPPTGNLCHYSCQLAIHNISHELSHFLIRAQTWNDVHSYC